MAYIEDANLIEEIKSLKISVGGKDVFPDEAKESVLRVISEQPIADVVEVVRCKDCKHLDRKRFCVRGVDGIGYKVVLPDDFCSYGERRTDNDL